MIFNRKKPKLAPIDDGWAKKMKENQSGLEQAISDILKLRDNKLKHKTMKKFSIDVQASGKQEMKKVRKYLRKNGYEVQKRKDALYPDKIYYLSNNDGSQINDINVFQYWDCVNNGEEILTLPQDWDKLITYAPPKKTRQVISIYGEVYDSKDIDMETFGKAFNDWLHDMGWNFIGEYEEDNKKVG